MSKSKEDLLIEIEEDFLDCQRLLYDSDLKHILTDTDSRIAFAAGYLGKNYKFLYVFFDVLLSGFVPDVPF